VSDQILHIDFETASLLDLKKVGASRYSRHPSTVVLCMSWAFDDEPVQHVLLPARHQYGLPDKVRGHLIQGGTLAAWNVHFEANLIENWFGLQLDPKQFECTMQRSLYGGLPAALGMAGSALRLPIQKDPAGHRLMLSMCKPRPLPRGKKTTAFPTFWHEDALEGPSKLAALAAYCDQDVEAERAISNYIPNLPPSERELAALDWESNRIGIKLDLQLIDRMMEIASAETALLNAECSLLTQGVITSPGTQTTALTRWFDWMGDPIPDVGKETIRETLEYAADLDLDPVVEKVLDLRQKVAKSSVAKLQAMLNAVDTDERVRGTLQYYGAGRTGRSSGRLIQPQNMPRPMRTIAKIVPQVVKAIKNGLDQEGIREFYGEPLEVVSTCLRGCLIPGDGKVFFVYDLAQIEARVLAWLSGQTNIVEAFRAFDLKQGPDIYQFTADQMGLGSRDAGKVAVLGLGYGMGAKHFVDFAKGYGITLTQEESESIVWAWRDANEQIVQFWSSLDTAIRMVLNQPPPYTIPLGGLQLETAKARNGDLLLTIKLPSGRRLFYRNCRLEVDPDSTRNGMAITYDGVDQYTKRWGPIRSWGAKFAENITQAVARDIIFDGATRIHGIVAKLVLSVHDEVVFEVDPIALDAQMSVDEAFLRGKEVIEEAPDWAKGLPVAAEGAVMNRYGKP